MTDRDVVERVGTLIERAVIPVRKRRAHHKTPYVTTIKGAPALSLMRAVHPYMGALRRPQIERAIASWRGHRARGQWPAARCPFEPSAHVSGPIGEGTQPNETRAIAWLTGLLEGEGTFSVNRQSAEIAYPVMKVEMCDEGVVARVGRLVGAPNVWRREAQKEGWNPTYIAAITGPQAAIWMRQLRDSMGIRRRAAIDAALAAYHPIYLIDPPDSCVVPGCSEPHRGRGLCHKHYMMWSRDKAKGRDARITPLR